MSIKPESKIPTPITISSRDNLALYTDLLWITSIIDSNAKNTALRRIYIAPGFIASASNLAIHRVNIDHNIPTGLYGYQERGDKITLNPWTHPKTKKPYPLSRSPIRGRLSDYTAPKNTLLLPGVDNLSIDSTSKQLTLLHYAIFKALPGTDSNTIPTINFRLLDRVLSAAYNTTWLVHYPNTIGKDVKANDNETFHFITVNARYEAVIPCMRILITR